MGTDRISLKLDARAKARGPVLKVTFVFLLLSSLVPSLLELIYSSPLNVYLNVVDWSTMQVEDIYALMATIPSNLITMATFFGILIGLIVKVLEYGYYYYTMKVARQEQDGGVRDLAYGFGMAGKIILLELYTTLLVALWSMLFVIPGIIAVYRYAMAPYILLDDPSISVYSEYLQRCRYFL
jgi:hypothetical protein